MRKINIAPRIAALVATFADIRATSDLIDATGYVYGTDPVEYWFPSAIDELGGEIAAIKDQARAIPGALDPRHERALAALRVALGQAERSAAAVLADYTAALSMAQAMERPADHLIHVICLAGPHAARRAGGTRSWGAGIASYWVD